MDDLLDPHLAKARITWQSAEAVEEYRRSRTPERFKRFLREEQVLGSWLESLARDSLVLDMPCGTGRCLGSIVRRGLRYIGADISPAMIAAARIGAESEPNADLVQGFLVADAEHLELPDNSVDCVVMWRFLHHVRNPKVRLSILREAARVARLKVLISFHHTVSFTNCRKAVQRFISRDTSRSPAITQWQLAREAGDCGLIVVETKSFQKYVSINWFACLAKF